MVDNTRENCETLARQIAGDMSLDELIDFVAYEMSERFHDCDGEFQDALASHEESYGPLFKEKG